MPTALPETDKPYIQVALENAEIKDCKTLTEVKEMLLDGTLTYDSYIRQVLKPLPAAHQKHAETMQTWNDATTWSKIHLHPLYHAFEIQSLREPKKAYQAKWVTISLGVLALVSFIPRIVAYFQSQNDYEYTSTFESLHMMSEGYKEVMLTLGVITLIGFAFGGGIGAFHCLKDLRSGKLKLVNAIDEENEESLSIEPLDVVCLVLGVILGIPWLCLILWSLVNLLGSGSG